MAGIKKSEFKKAIIAIEAERSKHSDATRLDLTQYPKIQKIRRAQLKLFTGLLRDAGLDMKKAASLREQHDAEQRRAVEKHKEAAIRRSFKKGGQYSGILGQSRAAVEALINETKSFSLLDPFLIWATPQSNIISDSQIAPSDSWAKIRVASSAQNGSNKLSFYFLWTNPLNNYVSIDPTTFLIATGYLEANADWGGLVHASGVSVDAQFFLWQWWQEPPVPISNPSIRLGNAQALGTYCRSDQSGKSISAGTTLSAVNFFVPPNSTVVFEVAFIVSYSSDSGNIVADFENGNFKVTCPVVTFTALESPFLNSLGDVAMRKAPRGSAARSVSRNS